MKSLAIGITKWALTTYASFIKTVLDDVQSDSETATDSVVVNLAINGQEPLASVKKTVP